MWNDWNYWEGLMGIAGTVVLVIGLYKRQRLDVAAGLCFVGMALSGHLAASDDGYAWLRSAFSLALTAVAIAKLFALKRRNQGVRR